MPGLCRYLLPLLLVGTWAMPVHSTVTVSFVQPGQYRDAGFGADQVNAVLKEIELHLKRLGDARLRAGEELLIEVLDIDRAGRRELRVGFDPNMRVVRDGPHVPSVRLRYRLQRGEGVEEKGEESYSDLGFLRRFNRYESTDPLRYEKQMLDDWFESRIVNRLRPGH